MVIPEAVRRLAEHPYRELPVPAAAELIERDGVFMIVAPSPGVQIVHPNGLAAADVARVVEAVRAIGKAPRGRRWRL